MSTYKCPRCGGRHTYTPALGVEAQMSALDEQRRHERGEGDKYGLAAQAAHYLGDDEWGDES